MKQCKSGAECEVNYGCCFECVKNDTCVHEKKCLSFIDVKVRDVFDYTQCSELIKA